MCVACADGEEDLADVDASDGAVGLAEGAAHARLQPIGAGAGQHLVDADDVVWVRTDAHVETLLASNLHKVPGVFVSPLTRSPVAVLNLLVGANTSGFQGLGAQLLVLVGDHVDAKREVIDTGALAAKIEDTNFRIGDTTVEARLGIRLL